LKEKNTEKYRKYLQAFWVESAGRLKAYESWMSYKAQVMLVQKLYATNFAKGFETDRGRVYLQYGAPNAIASRETSPSEYPYEVWQYDKIKNFSNKRFVFYNPDLVNNNYKLLHSDMVGELKNYRWQHLLTKRNSPNHDLDDPNDGNIDHFGGESGDVFKQF
jgi:GWxTD domain-containing protein